MYNKQPVFQRTLNEKKCWVESQRTLKSETLLIYFFETEGGWENQIYYILVIPKNVIIMISISMNIKHTLELK